MPYLAAGASGAAGAALVGAGGVGLSAGFWQPVRTPPTTRLNRTTTMYVLFIVGVNCTQSAKRTRKIFK